MTKRIVLCDVDLTVVDPIPAWINWLTKQTGYGVRLPQNNIDYDITKYWGDAIYESNVDAWDFWRQKDLYDTLYPIGDAVWALSDLDKRGYAIRFATHVKGYHYFSKVQFLKRYFPFMEGVAATKEKFMLHADFFVDDRIKHLNSMPEHVVKILAPTPYTQDEESKGGIVRVANWKEIHYTITNWIDLMTRDIE